MIEKQNNSRAAAFTSAFYLNIHTSQNIFVVHHYWSSRFV